MGKQRFLHVKKVVSFSLVTPLKYYGRSLHWGDRWLERQIWGEVSNIPWILMKGLDMTVDGEKWLDIKNLMSLFTWRLHL